MTHSMEYLRKHELAMAVKSDYEAGATIRQTARMHGLSDSAADRLLRKYGVKKRKRGVRPAAALARRGSPALDGAK